MEDWALLVPMNRISGREGVNSWKSQIALGHELRVFEELATKSGIQGFFFFFFFFHLYWDL